MAATEKSSDCLFHENVLKEVCRLCACRVRKQRQKDTSRLVTLYAPLIEVAYDIVAYSDNPNIHPSRVCIKCYSKLHRVKKNPDSQEAIKAKESAKSVNSQWTDHNYAKSLQSCFACKSYLQFVKGGRPTNSPISSPSQTQENKSPTSSCLYSTHFRVPYPGEKSLIFWPRSPLARYSSNTQQNVTPPTKKSESESAAQAQTVNVKQTPPCNKENDSPKSPVTPTRGESTVEDILNSSDKEPPTPLQRKLFSKLLKKHQNNSSSKLIEVDPEGSKVRTLPMLIF